MYGYGPASESLRLAEHYQRLTDEELIELARDSSELTEMAQHALAQEISSRRLKIPKPEAVPNPAPPPDALEQDSTYAQERQLVLLCVVYSLRDALQVQRFLNMAGIPFYIGPDKATTVEDVKSTFGDGVEVKVMWVGYPWARAALRNYQPKDEPFEEKVAWEKNAAIRCPKCRSEDVVFDYLVRDTNSKQPLWPKFHWTCGSCNHTWEDDGIAKRL